MLNLANIRLDSLSLNSAGIFVKVVTSDLINSNIVAAAGGNRCNTKYTLRSGTDTYTCLNAALS